MAARLTPVAASPFDADDPPRGPSPPQRRPPGVLDVGPPGVLDAPSAPETRLEAPPAPDVHTARTRYFVITSNTKENVIKSVRHSLWATQRKNERALDEAFREAQVVILVFSVNRSEAFQGYARMRSFVGKPRSRQIDPFNGFGRLFDIEWLRLHDLPYREVENVRNPLNGDRPVQFSRDGQELTNDAGRRLCGLIDRHIDDPESFPAQHPQGRQLALQDVRSTPPPPNLLPLAPFGVMMPAMPATQKRASSSSSSGSDGQKRKKKRKKEKKYRNAPHPLSSSFDDLLEFFLTLEYDDYIQWWQRHGNLSPGPTPPPGTLPDGQHPTPLVPASPMGAPSGLPPGQPPQMMPAAGPPGCFEVGMMGPHGPCGAPYQGMPPPAHMMHPHHMAHPPHMVPMHMAPAYG